jgi:molecular chaperone DnaK
MGSMEPLTMGGKAYTPPEISAFILRHLKGIAEAYLKESVEKAVITVPAYFSDAQRQATKDAGEVAGLEVARIINEPTAAALAYGVGREEDTFLLVYDLGGGTFDVSAVEQSGGVIEVRASHGNTRLGGDDFDERIVNELVEKFQDKHHADPREDRRAMARLWRAAEAGKIRLSDRPFTQIREEYLLRKGLSSYHFDVDLARFHFEEMIDDLLRSTLNSVDIALKDAGLKARDIQKILLVGGSTRIPAVRDLIQKHLGLEPHQEVNPEEVVALGAAIQGAIIAGEEVDAVLVDVTPYSLGIAVAEIQSTQLILDRYKMLIPRNTTIPTSKAEVFFTLTPEQDTVEVKVYQGEHSTASRNTSLGSFLFSDLTKPKDPDACREVVVQFDYDMNGIVHVTATDRGSGREKGIQITATKEGLSAEEKERARERVAEIEHPRAAEINALLTRAATLIERLKGEGDIETANEIEVLTRNLKEISSRGAEAAEGVLDRAIDDLIDVLYTHEP